MWTLNPTLNPRDCSKPPGRGTVLCARQILADGGDAVPPMPLAEHRTPLCVLCVSVVKPKTRVRPPIGADGEDAVPPVPFIKPRTLFAPDLYDFREPVMGR
jgi:hypothetical protein